ncbi:hypothetical protein CgunFtcFv8_003458 [Champsocephalus gunnari]|uniref:Uncharacterized protein n=1 Tax=Champsocephalus gunnari TaxID=52237 RepID=A0AAN8D8Q6_CHAGU|nr:hypothetical protein CgunFtcFv8_003458 [Champsocephalus gunnari]
MSAEQLEGLTRLAGVTVSISGQSRVHVGEIIWNQGSAPHVSPPSLWVSRRPLCPHGVCAAAWCSLVPAVKEHVEDINMVTCGGDPQAAERCCLVTVEGEGMDSYLLGSEVKNHVC